MGVPQGTPINTTSLPLSPSYPLRAIVTAHIPHLALHHLAKEVGGVNEIPPARVYAHVGYGPVPPCLLEEDQVAGAEVSLRDPLAVVPILFDRVVAQLLAELLEHLLRQTGAVLRAVCPADPRGRRPVGRAYVPARHPHDIPARGARVRRHHRVVAHRVAWCGAVHERRLVGAGGSPLGKGTLRWRTA